MSAKIRKSVSRCKSVLIWIWTSFWKYPSKPRPKKLNRPEFQVVSLN